MSAWKRDRALDTIDPWRAHWTRGDDTILADHTGVAISVEMPNGISLWLFCDDVYGRLQVQARLAHAVDGAEDTCAAIRDAWDEHRRLRAMRGATTRQHLAAIAVMAESR